MKTIQCAHPPHHHNGFVAACWLWTTSGGVHALLVLEHTECSTTLRKDYDWFNNHWDSADKNVELSQLVLAMGCPQERRLFIKIYCRCLQT